MNDPKQKRDGFLGFVIKRGGLPGLLFLSLLAIPVGYLAVCYMIWPLGIAYLLGVNITGGVFLALMVVPVALIILAAIYFPRQGDAFFGFLGKLYGLSLASTMFFFFCVLLPAFIGGFPLMLAVDYFFGIRLPVWSFLPIGLVVFDLYIVVGNRFHSKA
jgi:hypothetical protein